jgi:hypothetical protein
VDERAGKRNSSERIARPQNFQAECLGRVHLVCLRFLPNAWIQAHRPLALLPPPPSHHLEFFLLTTSSRFSLLLPLPPPASRRGSSNDSSYQPWPNPTATLGAVGNWWLITSKESAHPACAAIATLALTIATLPTSASRSEFHRLY